MLKWYWRNGSLQEVSVHWWFLHPRVSFPTPCSGWMNVWILHILSWPSFVARRSNLQTTKTLHEGEPAWTHLESSWARWKAPPKFILEWKWSRDIKGCCIIHRHDMPWSPWTQELGINVQLSITLLHGSRISCQVDMACTAGWQQNRLWALLGLHCATWLHTIIQYLQGIKEGHHRKRGAGTKVAASSRAIVTKKWNGQVLNLTIPSDF